MTTSERAGSNDAIDLRFNMRGNGCCKGNWSGMNIFAMVLGFVFFWPLGLVILYWIIKGRDVRDLPAAAKQQWKKLYSSDHDQAESDNVVFNEYQQTQYDRIRELKEEIKARARRFRNFRSDAQRRADEAEFQEFMSSNPGQEEK